MLRALLVTHGDLGRELLTTAQGIVGAADGGEVLSNRAESRDSLAQRVAEQVAAWGGAEGVVMADLFGGSCAQAVVSALPGHAEVAVVCGVNLAMLVDFLVNRGRYRAAEMGARLVDKGRAGVRQLTAPQREAGAA